MKKNIFQVTKILIAVIIAVGTYACSDLLNVKPTDVLAEDQFYRDKYDADAAIRGLYGKFIDLAPQYVVLNELRADLMDVTFNSDHHLREIADHNILTDDNAWVDPSPFFALINDCNNVIKNFTKMLEEFKLSEELYNSRISDVITLRSWIYLQLVIHYGEIPYLTEPIESFKDLESLDLDAMPKYGIEEMVSQLIEEMVNIPTLNRYTDESLYRQVDGFHTRTMFIPKDYFLAELFLWDGQYDFAASLYRNILEGTHGGYSGYTHYDQYKMPYRDNTRADNPGSSKYTSGYLRYFDNDLNSVVNFWPLMYEEYGTQNYYTEWIWIMNYHKDYKPSPFYKYFSIEHGDYLLKPSEKIMKDWNAQIQANGFTGDFRGSIEDIFGNTGSYIKHGGNPVIIKYIGHHNEINSTEMPGVWPLVRAGGLNLRYAEAANRAGQTYVASAIMNSGIGAAFQGSDLHPERDFTYRRISYKTDAFGEIEYDYTYDENGNVVDTVLIPLTSQYYFDARSTSDNDIPPIHRGEWHRNTGVRGRVSLSNIIIPTGEANPMLYLEDRIIEETARETAFEGQRWGDLVRISIRRGDNTFLANQVAKKFEEAGESVKAQEIRDRLSVRENWFLKLKK